MWQSPPRNISELLKDRKNQVRPYKFSIEDPKIEMVYKKCIHLANDDMQQQRAFVLEIVSKRPTERPQIKR